MQISQLIEKSTNLWFRQVLVIPKSKESEKRCKDYRNFNEQDAEAFRNHSQINKQLKTFTQKSLKREKKSVNKTLTIENLAIVTRNSKSYESNYLHESKMLQKEKLQEIMQSIQ